MKKQIMTSFLLFLTSTLFAASNPMVTLESLLNNMKTFQATFDQIIKDDAGHIVQEGQGTVALQRPGKFQWLTSHPTKQEVVADGKNLWIYDPELEQATVQNLTESIHQSPAILISEANLNLADDFYVTTEKDENQKLWYVLTPKSKEKSEYRLVKIYFNGNQLQSLKVLNNLGQWNILRFKNIKTNLSLSQTLFNFKPPMNVDVIDNTNKGTYAHD
ncbi:MAG: outer membrane lipoprotein chaperone LolA [Gammaproteobacteria bacterium]